MYTYVLISSCLNKILPEAEAGFAGGVAPLFSIFARSLIHGWNFGKRFMMKQSTLFFDGNFFCFNKIALQPSPEVMHFFPWSQSSYQPGLACWIPHGGWQKLIQSMQYFGPNKCFMPLKVLQSQFHNPLQKGGFWRPRFTATHHSRHVYFLGWNIKTLQGLPRPKVLLEAFHNMTRE